MKIILVSAALLISIYNCNPKKNPELNKPEVAKTNSENADQNPNPTRSKSLTYIIPEDWISESPKSSMRKAQYKLSGRAGPGECVLFHFPGGGGSVEANIKRWESQVYNVSTVNDQSIMVISVRMIVVPRD